MTDRTTTHAHGHGEGVTAGPRARLVLTAILVPVLMLALAGAWLLRPGDAPVPTFSTTAPGATMDVLTVLSVDASQVSEPQVRAERADGTEVRVHAAPEFLPELDPGARIRAISLPADVGGGEGIYVFMDLVRDPPMLLLAVTMALLVVVVARWRGLAALVGLGLTLAALAVFTLPALLIGQPALPVALVSAVLIMTVVLYLAHGFSARTSTALLGTIVGIALTAGISAWATGAARLHGLGGEVSLDLLDLAPAMSLEGVLLCGFVLAGLGVLNDVTITQASAVWELRASSPDASRRQVFSRAMRIGRDHIASTVYTIAFAYVGAALPLVLMVTMSDRPLLEVVTSGEVAEEVVRTMVGSIGLVLAIPLTTAIAAVVAGPRSLVAGRHPAFPAEAVPAGA